MVCRLMFVPEYFRCSDPAITGIQACAAFGFRYCFGTWLPFLHIRQGRFVLMVLLPLDKGHNVFGNTLILPFFPELYALIVALAATFLMGSALAA